MLTRSKLLFAALAAAAMMLALVANASARNFRITEREFEVLFNGSEGLHFEAAGNNINCKITLLGHFLENTIPKIVGTKVGVVRHVEPTTAAEPPCTGGTITVLTETLPWGVNYGGFTGRLPEITRIRLNLIGVAFRVRVTSNGLACLAGTNSREPASGEISLGANGRAETLRADETVGIRLGGGFLCEIAGNSHFSGTGTILPLPRTGSILVTLI